MCWEDFDELDDFDAFEEFEDDSYYNPEEDIEAIYWLDYFSDVTLDDLQEAYKEFIAGSMGGDELIV